MSQLLSSKIVIVEEEPQVRGIPTLPTSVAGAVGLAERGPINKAVLCSSYEDYLNVFGGLLPGAFLPLAARGFFENGGTALWVVRVAHYDDIDERSTLTSRIAQATLIAPDPADPAQSINAMRVLGKDPGAYANSLELEVRPPTSGAPETFDFAVIDEGNYREIFANLSLDPAQPRYAPLIVNDAVRGSRLIALDDLVAGVATLPLQRAPLSGGDDGLAGLADTDFIGSKTTKTALYALDEALDLSIVIVPDRATPAVHAAMLNYCEFDRKGFAFAILDPPAQSTPAEIIRYVEVDAALLETSEFGAIYWPRLEVLHPSPGPGERNTLTVPPSGIIAGVFARLDGSRPGGVYQTPAGTEEGRLLGVIGFENNDVLEENVRDLLYPKRINPLTTAPALPRFIDGSKTLKSGGNFPYIAERRGVSFIERSLRQGLQPARHKPHTEALRAQVRRTITAFLLTQMRIGAFRSNEPDKAFFVDASAQLNPPEVVLAGQLIVRVGLATNKPAEFLILRISQDTRSLIESLG